ncbi:hypothetical protein P389DRAFT_192816 [Cystobasidium minutum MCA 4210]|uniref:uncharacterized protein n=1 Tax=Cystobasidium minutum MCA 4210 TaxID=1397322 RepID=UPI0034CDC4D1|eukprot:jgi/Rhomi1/192816/gm1.1030_g
MADEFKASITCERSIAKNCIGAIIRTILFQRALGNISPGSRDVLGITLPCINPAPAELEAIVEARVDEIYKAAIATTTSTTTAAAGASGSSTAISRAKKTEATVSLCKERIKRTWYSKSVEEIPWEEYKLTFEIMSGQTERERNKIDAVTKSQLSAFLMELITFTDQHKSNTPPITNNDVVPFPWKITTASSSGSTT